MVEHVFGGGWTAEKLERLSGYLNAYRSIFQNNEKARYFTTWYVDAFAGTGQILPSKASQDALPLLEESDLDQEKAEFLDGSAKIALDLPSPFDRYLFIDEQRRRVETLRDMVTREHPALLPRVDFKVGDANQTLCNWCKARDWNKERAVVFLDPYGMQVEWNTVKTLGETGGVDLWYLFPFITRLLRNDQNMDEAWRKRLDILLGTSEWASRFYPIHQQETLFGNVEDTRRDVTESGIQEFIEERLGTCFVKVAPSSFLRNSKMSPLYALCFAASNPKGSETAFKIAKYLLQQ